MKQLVPQAGYTMIEVMIVLAVSIALLASAVSIFNGRIQQTQFTQSVRNLDSKIQSVFNDVGSGFFPSQAAFSCDAGNGAQPTFGSSSRDQGTNSGCIFLGKVFHLASGNPPDNNCVNPTVIKEECDTINIMTVAGNRQLNGQDVENYSEAYPKIADQLTELYTTNYRLSIYRAFVPNGSGVKDISMFGAFYTLGSSSEALASGSRPINIIPIEDIGTVGESVAAVTSSQSWVNRTTLKQANAGKPITICLLSGTNDQLAAIVVNANNEQASTDVLFDDNVPAECI